MVSSVSASKAQLQASPDFKGIKTLQAACFPTRRLGFKPALISKGLRLDLEHVASLHLLQASPDFKGIKT